MDAHFHKAALVPAAVMLISGFASTHAESPLPSYDEFNSGPLRFLPFPGNDGPVFQICVRSGPPPAPIIQAVRELKNIHLIGGQTGASGLP